MAEVVGLLGRDPLPQLPLHLKGILGAVGDPQPSRDADAVGVADIGGLAEHVPQNQIGGLAPHAGKAGQFLHGAGDSAAVFIHQLLGTGHDVPGLAVVKAAGVDVFAHLRRIRLGKALQRGEAGVQRRGHLVHPLVCALGGHAHREQQLVVLFIL